MIEKKVKTLKSIKGKILTYEQDEVMIDNNIHIRDIIKHPGAVAIVAINKEKELLCVKQFRYATNDYLLEIPAGKLDGSDIENEIKRELIEETKYTFNSCKYLGEFYVAPGYSNELIHLFFTEDIYVYDGDKEYSCDVDEYVDIEFLNLSKLEELFLSNKLNDAKTIIGYLYIKGLYG